MCCSPLKSTIRAVRDAAGSSRRVPLGTMLERLERAVAPTIPRAPAKVAPTRASSSSTTILNKAISTNNSARRFSNAHAAIEQAATIRCASRNYTSPSYYAKRWRSASNVRQMRWTGRCPHPLSLAEASKVPGTFMDVLKVYYPSSKTTLEMMVHDEGRHSARRPPQVHRKGQRPARRSLRLAFVNSDKDKSGCLELNEFIDTVKWSHAQPPGYCKDKRATRTSCTAIHDDLHCWRRRLRWLPLVRGVP